MSAASMELHVTTHVLIPMDLMHAVVTQVTN